jgi:D-aspartate ligase
VDSIVPPPFAPTRRAAPIVLADPDYYGTLAATRALGASGVPVYIAGRRLLAVSRWSRHAARALACPPLSRPAEHVEWLLELGEREPGLVLYPTSDDATFVYTQRLQDLSRVFRMYQPELGAILHVLDKKRLYETAREVGLEVPDTWCPETDADVERVAREAPMPLVIKPRTQMLSTTHSKGVIVHERHELARTYRSFVKRTSYDDTVLAVFPEAPRAMLQAYWPEAAERIYSLAGFLDRSGKLFAARAAVKVFQRPRTLGIGLCFADAPIEPELSDAARRLALACGYFGVFQLEFIEVGDRRLLIDLNPRFYNQLAYDIARGLALPHMVHAAALGDGAEVERLVAVAQRQPDRSDLVYCNRFGFEVMLATQRVVGRVSASEAARWRRWRDDHRSTSIDPAHVRGDALPAFVDVASQVYSYARHPRAFVRKVILDQQY